MASILSKLGEGEKINLRDYPGLAPKTQKYLDDNFPKLIRPHNSKIDSGIDGEKPFAQVRQEIAPTTPGRTFRDDIVDDGIVSGTSEKDVEVDNDKDVSTAEIKLSDYLHNIPDGDKREFDKALNNFGLTKGMGMYFQEIERYAKTFFQNYLLAYSLKGEDMQSFVKKLDIDDLLVRLRRYLSVSTSTLSLDIEKVVPIGLNAQESRTWVVKIADNIIGTYFSKFAKDYVPKTLYELSTINSIPKSAENVTLGGRNTMAKTPGSQQPASPAQKPKSPDLKSIQDLEKKAERLKSEDIDGAKSELINFGLEASKLPAYEADIRTKAETFFADYIKNLNIGPDTTKQDLYNIFSGDAISAFVDKFKAEDSLLKSDLEALAPNHLTETDKLQWILRAAQVIAGIIAFIVLKDYAKEKFWGIVETVTKPFGWAWDKISKLWKKDPVVATPDPTNPTPVIIPKNPTSTDQPKAEDTQTPALRKRSRAGRALVHIDQSGMFAGAKFGNFVEGGGQAISTSGQNGQPGNGAPVVGSTVPGTPGVVTATPTIQTAPTTQPKNPAEVTPKPPEKDPKDPTITPRTPAPDPLPLPLPLPPVVPAFSTSENDAKIAALRAKIAALDTELTKVDNVEIKSTWWKPWTWFKGPEKTEHTIEVQKLKKKKEKLDKEIQNLIAANTSKNNYSVVETPDLDIEKEVVSGDKQLKDYYELKGYDSADRKINKARMLLERAKKATYNTPKEKNDAIAKAHTDLMNAREDKADSLGFMQKIFHPNVWFKQFRNPEKAPGWKKFAAMTIGGGVVALGLPLLPVVGPAVAAGYAAVGAAMPTIAGGTYLTTAGGAMATKMLAGGAVGAAKGLVGGTVGGVIGGAMEKKRRSGHKIRSTVWKSALGGLLGGGLIGVAVPVVQEAIGGAHLMGDGGRAGANMNGVPLENGQVSSDMNGIPSENSTVSSSGHAGGGGQVNTTIDNVPSTPSTLGIETINGNKSIWSILSNNFNLSEHDIFVSHKIDGRDIAQFIIDSAKEQRGPKISKVFIEQLIEAQKELPGIGKMTGDEWFWHVVPNELKIDLTKLQAIIGK